MSDFKIYNKDAIEVMKKMISEGTKVDCIITDPPYEITKRGNSGNTGGMLNTDASRSGKIFKHNSIKPYEYAPLFYKILKEGTHAYVMTNAKNLQTTINDFTNVGFKLVKPLVWVKPNKIMGRWYMTQFETILLFRKGKARPINNAGTSDVIFTKDFKKEKHIVNGKKKNLHDTEKPISLMEVLVNNSTNENEIVFDPFVGIGSTGIAAIKNNRKFLGSELDDHYYVIANERIEKEVNNGCN